MTSWYPAAELLPGSASKSGYPNKGNREGKGVVVHSAEGWRPSMESGLLNPSLAKSWHFSVYLDGHVQQHYPLETMTWHAKTPANYNYAGIECEGIAGTPVGGVQLDSLVNLLKWQREQEGWTETKRGVTLWEHNEFVATACPSGRIPWDTILAEMAVAPPKLPMVVSYAETDKWRYLTFDDDTEWALTLSNPRFDGNDVLTFDVLPRET